MTMQLSNGRTVGVAYVASQHQHIFDPGMARVQGNVLAAQADIFAPAVRIIEINRPVAEHMAKRDGEGE